MLIQVGGRSERPPDILKLMEIIQLKWYLTTVSCMYLHIGTNGD